MTSTPTPDDRSGILNRHPRVPHGVAGPPLSATLLEILAWFDRHVMPYRAMIRAELYSRSNQIVLRLQRGLAPFEEHLRPGALREEYHSALGEAVRRCFPALLAASIHIQ